MKWLRRCIIAAIILMGSSWLLKKSPINSASFLQKKKSFIQPKGEKGYVIVKGASIYFVREKNMPKQPIKDVDWSIFQTSLGHPTNDILFGTPLDEIRHTLKTGDAVEVWFSVVLTSFPGRIKVERIERK